MKDPYLVQRCTLRQTPNTRLPGFDKHFECNYMGSAEFEFGALPVSLKVIVSKLSEYEVIKTDTIMSYHENGKEFEPRNAGVFLFGPKKMNGEILEAFNKLQQTFDLRHRGPLRLKEPVWLDYALDFRGKPYGFKPVVLLWDIENHWFACLGKSTINLLQKSLEALRFRWATEGKI